MINVQYIDGRNVACWVNEGGFLSNRKTMVFIHGFGGNHSDWTLQYTHLKNAFNIVAIDLPGHGQSDGPGEQYVPALAAWVKKLVEGFRIAKPVLVGHSLGAAICLHLAICHNDMTAAVVLVGGGARMPVNPVLLEGLKKEPAAIIGLVAKLSVAKVNRERLYDLITEKFSRVTPSILHGDFTACDRLDVMEAIGRIVIPSLVVCGTEDKMTPPALSACLGKHISGAKLVFIEGAGHFVMMENPEAFNTALTDFVNSLPA